ncbi:MAG: hypothetical protein RLZZ206_514 [Cyanobacteriota bacterium]|jgi:hypothetical protein
MDRCLPPRTPCCPGERSPLPQLLPAIISVKLAHEARSMDPD